MRRVDPQFNAFVGKWFLNKYFARIYLVNCLPISISHWDWFTCATIRFCDRDFVPVCWLKCFCYCPGDGMTLNEFILCLRFWSHCLMPAVDCLWHIFKKLWANITHHCLDQKANRIDLSLWEMRKNESMSLSMLSVYLWIMTSKIVHTSQVGIVSNKCYSHIGCSRKF